MFNESLWTLSVSSSKVLPNHGLNNSVKRIGTRCRPHMKIVYDHRSKALHAGMPFPQPMLGTPYFDDQNGLSELPLGMSAGGAGASWMAQEFPLTLQTFEHIMRGCPVTWWQELPEAQ